MMENENLLPKNIRQIGEIQGRQKICLEDYVMTYIRKMESKGDANYLGVFLGERKNTDNAEYIFVRGIMEVPDFSQTGEKDAARKEKEAANTLGDGEKDALQQNRHDAVKNKEEKKEQEHLGLWQAFQKRYGTKEELQGAPLDDKQEEKGADKSAGSVKDKLEEEIGEDCARDWTVAWRREQERRFPGWEIQGCCVIGTYPSGRLEELSGHLPETARMIYHLQDQEERLYWQEGGRYEGVRGYFVFYEQNQKMQEYLSELFGDGSVEKEGGSDSAIISFREKVRSRAEEKSQSFLRLASSFFVVGVLLIGAIVVNRVSDMREAQSVSGTAQSVSETAQSVSGTTQISSVSESTDIVNGTTDEEASVSEESALAGSNAFWADEEADGAENESDTDGSTGRATENVADAASTEAASASTADTGTASANIASTDTVSTDIASTDTANADTVSADAAVSETAGVGFAVSAAADEESAAEATETASRQIQAAYVIREGDTLAEICARYYGSLDHMEELCEANGIEDANLILPGQKIVLP
ncbi:MAG: LysM peptidoglycan-binding domain-containing protein [Lachnospiraceae bacterium]|nr:LysM peptidoglycan-binding domain-containing protein [Lachnospiraceae bacterium]